jgi:hypothetical protein
MRSFPQIPARIKYFIAIAEYFEGRGGGGPTSFRYDATIQLPSYPGPILTETEFDAAYNDPSGYLYPGLYQGELLKDMGQQFTITDDSFNHIAIYRRVQRVRGLPSEGVGGSPGNSWGTFYVKVWDADASSSEPVYVARTG